MNLIYNAAPLEFDDVNPEEILSPAGMEWYHAFNDSYVYACAFIIDNDTIVINNGTGAFFVESGIIVTRNGKTFDNEELKDSDLFSGYDGNTISINGKVDGYDNVYSWCAGT